jgi:L-arabinose isomerase
MTVGLVPLYLKLYDQIDPGLRGSLTPVIDSVRDALASVGEVVESGIITQPREVPDLVRRLADRKVDAVFTVHLAYSPSLLVADALRRLGRPVVLVSTSLSRSFSEMSEGFLLQNHGIHGVMDLASVLQSMGVECAVVAGHHGDPRLKEQIARKARLLAAAGAFRGQRIAATGGAFPLMGDFAVSFRMLQRRYGIRVAALSERAVMDRAAGITEERCKAVLRMDREAYAVEESLADVHAESVRSYIALSDILTAGAMSAYTMNYLDFRSSPAPFYAACRLMADGWGYAGEGDVLTASLGRPLNILAGKAMFSEIFCPDWDSGRLIMSHMGECDPRFALPGARGTLAARKALGSAFTSLYYRFPFAPGPLTFASFAKTREGGLRLAVGVMDAVEQPGFDCFPAPHFVVKPRAPLADFLPAYSAVGAGHHLYLAAGEHASLLREWAAMAGIEAAAVEPGSAAVPGGKTDGR